MKYVRDPNLLERTVSREREVEYRERGEGREGRDEQIRNEVRPNRVWKTLCSSSDSALWR